MVLYKRPSQSPDSPWGLSAYINEGQLSWAFLGFGEDRGTDVSLFQAQRIIDLVPNIIQNIMHLRHKAGIILGITGLGLNVSCDTSIPLTGLVFNWL